MKSAIAILAILSISGSAAPALATPQAPVVALSNAYYGNTWRHQMVEAFEAAAKQAKADGKIADYIVMNGDGSVAQQNSQIGELILKRSRRPARRRRVGNRCQRRDREGVQRGDQRRLLRLDRLRAVQLSAQLRFQRL